MFTGIIEQLGTVFCSEQHSAGISLSIDCVQWEESFEIGESIAVAGCCLTLVGQNKAVGCSRDNVEQVRLQFDVIPESLRCTKLGNLEIGSEVNLERAIKAGRRIGGHIVHGHVNCTSVVKSINQSNGEYRIAVNLSTGQSEIPIIAKGCIAIDGVSLTVASLNAMVFEVAIIPETLRRTTLGQLKEGEFVNVEFDSPSFFARG